MSILDRLENKQVLLCDGAWGTFLQATGLKPGECPELWNVTRRGDVIKIAESYLEAAAEISRQAAGTERHVAGCVGPTGKILIMGDVTEEQLYEAFKEQSVALEEGGADRNIPVIIQANAGVPELIDGKTVFRESPEMMASFVPALIEAGADIIGGCCGTTPAHIKEIRKIIR